MTREKSGWVVTPLLGALFMFLAMRDAAESAGWELIFALLFMACLAVAALNFTTRG